MLFIISLRFLKLYDIRGIVASQPVNAQQGVKMKNIKYVVYKEDKYYVSQCLNVDVSSFGETIDEAIASLKEAVSLYFEDENSEYNVIGEALLGEDVIHA